MGIDNRTQQDSARLLRYQYQGAEAAKAIKTISTITQSQTSSERDASPVEKLFEFDQFGQSSPLLQARHDQVKKDYELVAFQSKNIKDAAQKQYQEAGNNAQALAALIIINEEPDVLKFLKKADDKGDLANLSPEEFEARVDRLLEDPDQLPYIMKDVLTSDMAAKRKEFQNDPEKLAELDAKEAQLSPIFSALSALDNNGSHEEMFPVIENIAREDMTPRLNGLVKKYMNSLADIGRAQKHHLTLFLQHEKSFLSVDGVVPKVDKYEFRSMYDRTGYAFDGAQIATRNGGITGAGKIWNYDEASVPISIAGNVYERYTSENIV